jgi:hypothetical protein
VYRDNLQIKNNNLKLTQPFIHSDYLIEDYDYTYDISNNYKNNINKETEIFYPKENKINKLNKDIDNYITILDSLMFIGGGDNKVINKQYINLFKKIYNNSGIFGQYKYNNFKKNITHFGYIKSENYYNKLLNCLDVEKKIVINAILTNLIMNSEIYENTKELYQHKLKIIVK